MTLFDLSLQNRRKICITQKTLNIYRVCVKNRYSNHTTIIAISLNNLIMNIFEEICWYQRDKIEIPHIMILNVHLQNKTSKYFFNNSLNFIIGEHTYLCSFSRASHVVLAMQTLKGSTNGDMCVADAASMLFLSCDLIFHTDETRCIF